MSYLVSNAEWHRTGKYMFVVMNGVKQKLPRFYKDKLFNKDTGEVMEVKDLYTGELVFRPVRIRTDRFIEAPDFVGDYWEEVERLAKFHDDPTAYYEEKIRYAHDQVIVKSNSKDKL